MTARIRIWFVDEDEPVFDQEFRHDSPSGVALSATIAEVKRSGRRARMEVCELEAPYDGFRTWTETFDTGPEVEDGYHRIEGHWS